MHYMFMDTNCVSDKTFYPSCLMCKGTYCTVRCPMVIMFPFLISFIWFVYSLRVKSSREGETLNIDEIWPISFVFLYFLFACMNSELKLRRKRFLNSCKLSLS